VDFKALKGSSEKTVVLQEILSKKQGKKRSPREFRKKPREKRTCFLLCGVNLFTKSYNRKEG
jgi:hypothetical protein